MKSDIGRSAGVGLLPIASRDQTRETSRLHAARSSAKSSPLLVAALIVFIALEYLRPPFLQPLRIQLMLLVLLPVAWLASKEHPWSRSLTLLVLFLVSGLLMMPFATNYFVIYMNARLMYGFFVTALAVTWLLAERSAFKRVIWVWVAMMTFEAVWGITHGGFGYGSALHDENDLSLALVMAVPFPLLGFLQFRGARRWLCAIIALVLVIGIIVSFSRGGFLGLIATSSYSLLAGGRHRARSLAIGCALAAVFFLAVPSSYKREMGTMENTTEGTAETRLFIWITATKIWRAYPILGAGPENASFLLGKYQPGPMGGLFDSPAFWDRSWSMTAIHSVYFQLLADRGLVGASLFAWMTVICYSGLRRLRHDVRRMHGAAPGLRRDADFYALGLESAMGGFLVGGAFLSMLYYPYFWFLTALAVAHERAIRREEAGSLVPEAAHANREAATGVQGAASDRPRPGASRAT